MLCDRTLKMSLSVVVLFCVLSYVSGDTDSIDRISNRVTCRDVMREMRSLFEEQETKFMKRFEQMQKQINNIATVVGSPENDTATSKESLKTEINNVAMIARSLEQGMASVQYDVREVKSVKLANITTSIRSLEQGMASVQFDLKEMKSVTLGNITTSVRSLEQGMASVQYDLREVKSVTLGQ